MKILVCDSDPAVVSLIRFVLTRELIGEVVVAQNGQEALGMIENLSFDMVITEIHSDQFSGFDIVTCLRKDLRYHTPVLLLANYGQDDLVLNGFKAGADDYILKPFSLTELTLRIKRFSYHDKGK